MPEWLKKSLPVGKWRSLAEVSIETGQSELVIENEVWTWNNLSWVKNKFGLLISAGVPVGLDGTFPMIRRMP
jgi:hypothetical protein